MQYQIGDIREFDVIKDFGEREDFFRLHIPGAGEARLPKLKFQREEPLPDKVRCRIKYINGDMPVPGHFVPQYVNRFYKAGVTHKRDFEFTVVGLPAHAGDKFILEDKYGIRYNLDGRGNILAEGQKVLCHFTKLSNTLFNLELTKSDMRLPFFAPHEFLREIGVRGILNSFLIRLAEVSLADACEEYRANNPLWVVTALKTAASQLSELFVGSDIKRHKILFGELLRIIRTGCLYLIENSRFLRNLSDRHRRSIQAVLTEAVESMGPCRDILDLVADSKQCDFVESLMHKLRESGYLYHPARQFSILMMIFRTQPELVQEYLGKIFETIMEWRLETWTTEPFRSAFVGQFEMYIRQACREIDLLPQADTEADADRIEKIVTAIALQMLISGDSTSDSYRRNRSLFYRYISLLRPVKSEDLLDKAFLTLMGVSFPLEFNYDNIKEPLMLMTRATVRPADDRCHLQSIHTYREGGVELTVSDNGIALRRTDEDNAGRILPNGMMDWLSPQIYLDGVQSLNGNQINSFEAHHRLWTNIESVLFERRVHAEEIGEEQHKAEPGDVVKIVISSDENPRSDNPRWVALIDDERYLPLPGYIFRDDIVGFMLRSVDLDRDRITAQSAFVGENGRPRHFMAAVKEIDPDGLYHFSLLADVAEQCSNIMSYDEVFRAVIAQRHGYEYSGIAETGYGVYLRPQAGSDVFSPGDIVSFRIYDRSNPGHIVGTIIDSTDARNSFDKVTAFANLMRGISLIEDNYERDESMILDMDETLTREDVSEIVELIRFKAISSSTLLLAYDYLQFGRLLALAIEDTQLAERLQIHADLLRMHQFYATNRRVDADELELYRPKVSGYPLLEVVFHRLEIVSWLGDSDRNGDLWQTVNMQRNLLESNLARLVLSYNMLPASADGEADRLVSDGLKSKIARMLGVNYEARQLKSYGRENQFIEFKSSLVYPARKFKHDKMKADPEAQQFVILKIIASFLNSSGGTLYIGVNDSTHCEAGLYEDFEYYKHHRAAVGSYQYDMRSVDNMCVFLANLVRFTWGNIVAGSVQIEQDDEASHDVIIVKVQPRTIPVLLDGKIYVRRSGNTNMLLDEERVEFIRERQELERRKQEDLRVKKGGSDIESPEPLLKTAGPLVPAADIASEPSDTYTQALEKGIATSAWRHNVLHEWEDGYLPPAGYLYFKGDCTLVRTVEDRQFDYDSDCELALAFTEREASQGMLVIVYDTKRVLKVPMCEIMEKDSDRAVGYSNFGQPVFATIALPADALITYLFDNKNTLYRRVIPLADIESQHLNSTPGALTEAPGVAGVAACEIAASSSLTMFAGSMSKDMSTRQVGYTLRATAGSEKAHEILNEDRKAGQPHVKK